MMRRHDSLRVLFTSLFALSLLTGILSDNSAGSLRLGRSTAIAKEAPRCNSPAPTGIKSHQNESEVCQAIPWFGCYAALAMESGYSGYDCSLKQEPFSLWNAKAGHGRSPPASCNSSKL